MKFDNYEHMDPCILYSGVNMELRDRNIDLGEFCKIHDIDMDKLKEILARAGFTYSPEHNQFR